MARIITDITNDRTLPKKAFLYGGPPISGKDAQTDAVEIHAGIPVFKTGKILSEIASKKPGGPEDIAIRGGDLADDGIAIWTAKTWIIRHLKHPIIKLNGIPRRITQMKIINFLRDHGFAPYVIWLTTPIHVCINRPYRPDRSDETLESRKRRMQRYTDETEPVLSSLADYAISEANGNLLLIDNSEMQKPEVAEKIITHFRLPYQVSQIFPQEQLATAS